MTERVITFVGCDETPDQYRQYVGQTAHLGDTEGLPWPSPGFEGTFWGRPGRMLPGDRWEIRPVDMRDQATRWLDEADELLREPPVAGEMVGSVARRHAKAQQLILKAMSKRVRGMRTS